MRTVQTRLAKVVQKQGLSFKQLAERVDCNVRSLHNEACGSSCSLSLRQRVTNALQVDEIWPGVFMTERILEFGPGVEVVFPKAEQALDALEELNAVEPTPVARLRGTTIAFVKPVVFVVEIRQEENQSVRNRGISAVGSNE